MCIEAKRPVLVFTGMLATGAGTRGGMGITLENCHPRYARFNRSPVPRPECDRGQGVLAVAVGNDRHRAAQETRGLELHGWSPRYYSDELKREIAKRLRKRVFYGADYPMSSHERLVGEWREQGFADDVLDDIFHRNAEAFLASVGVT